MYDIEVQRNKIIVEFCKRVEKCVQFSYERPYLAFSSNDEKLQIIRNNFTLEDWEPSMTIGNYTGN